MSRVIFNALAETDMLQAAFGLRQAPSDKKPVSRAVPMHVAEKVFTANQDFYLELQRNLRRRRRRVADVYDVRATVLSIPAFQDNQESRGEETAFSLAFLLVHGIEEGSPVTIATCTAGFSEYLPRRSRQIIASLACRTRTLKAKNRSL